MNLGSLPQETLLPIIQHVCSSVASILSMRQTCWIFYTLCSDNTLWVERCQKCNVSVHPIMNLVQVINMHPSSVTKQISDFVEQYSRRSIPQEVEFLHDTPTLMALKCFRFYEIFHQIRRDFVSLNTKHLLEQDTEHHQQKLIGWDQAPQRIFTKIKEVRYKYDIKQQRWDENNPGVGYSPYRDQWYNPEVLALPCLRGMLFIWYTSMCKFYFEMDMDGPKNLRPYLLLDKGDYIPGPTWMHAVNRIHGSWLNYLFEKEKIQTQRRHEHPGMITLWANKKESEQ